MDIEAWGGGVAGKENIQNEFSPSSFVTSIFRIPRARLNVGLGAGHFNGVSFNCQNHMGKKAALLIPVYRSGS